MNSDVDGGVGVDVGIDVKVGVDGGVRVGSGETEEVDSGVIPWTGVNTVKQAPAATANRSIAIAVAAFNVG